MSPRVAYWTSAFQADMEAVASEVKLLRGEFPRSIAWGLSHHHWLLPSWQKGCAFHPRLHWLFRMATWLLEPAFDVNHVFGSVGDWFYLQGERWRPTIVTVATQAAPVSQTLLSKVAQFVVEYPGGRQVLEQLGIQRGRIRLILPAVDLTRFVPRPMPPEPFTIVFASSPDKESWLEARGVPQLLDLAEQRPQYRFRLLWRPWGDSHARVEKWLSERRLRNVQLIVSRHRDMVEQYQSAHVCIAPFTDPERCKPAPNSLIESLACGRPVLVTPIVGLADLIREGRGGLVSAPSGEALGEQLDRIRSDLSAYSQAARAMAERFFGVDRFIQSYRQLYQEVLTDRRSRARVR